MPIERMTPPSGHLQAFQELRSYLCSEPVDDYPCKDHPYNLITDASFEDDTKPRGLGAILRKTNK
jgi:hypothetical protein